MNPKITFYFDKPNKFQKEIQELRKIALESELVEELKWGCPCYTLEGKNVFLIHYFKDYCALLFVKGSLMQDFEGILIKQSANVQSAKQLRFTNLQEIKKLSKTIANYIEDAINVEKSGKKVVLKSTAEFEMPEEFSEYLKEDGDLQLAFKKLTAGRQRAYLLFFGAAKQSKTRMQRIEKYKIKILAGKGLYD